MSAINKTNPSKRSFWARFLLTIGILISVIFSLVFVSIVTIFFVGAASPLTVHRYVISDGSRIVVFEGMVHLGRPSFYDSVREDIITQKNNGSTYFYENVRRDPDQSVNSELDSRLLGTSMSGTDIRDIFGLMSLYADIDLQPQKSFMGLVNTMDRNVDVSSAEMLDTLKNAGDSPMPAAEIKAITREQVDTAREAWKRASPTERSAVSWTVRTLIRSAIRISSAFPGASSLPANFEKYALDDRNKLLADAVAHGPDRIVITYGEAHFAGFFRLLQAANPSWKIVETSDRQAF